MHVTAVTRPAPRPRAAIEPVVGTASRERRDPGRHREPIVVHVPVPLDPGGTSSAVRDAYRLEGDRRAVDLYL